jgi:uncharacterized protein (UPF0335 family)
MTSGHNHQLHSIVQRIEQLEAAKADTVKAINHTYAAAKADGYDIRALRAVIRLRAWDRKELADHEAKVDAYTDALFAFEHTPLGRAMSPPAVGPAEDAKRAGG